VRRNRRSRVAGKAIERQDRRVDAARRAEALRALLAGGAPPSDLGFRS
jgi:hypothetical protein